ncbi:MAG: secretin N-terminal domain-containing protein [Planctomycetota bacterium]|nr:secretin N-terminal domain-containing protein [Planctomycetota bacterium]
MSVSASWRLCFGALVVLTAASVTLIPSPAVAQNGEEVPGVEARLTETWQDAPLPDVLKYLTERSGVNIVIVDEAAKDAKVTVEVTDLGWRDTLTTIMKLTGCEADEITAQLIHVKSLPRVDMDFVAADLTRLISLIAAKAGVNIIISPEVAASKTNITMRLSDVPWKDALEAVVKSAGFMCVEEAHDIIRVVSASKLLDQMETRMYTLKYVRPPSTFKATIKTTYALGGPKATGDAIKEFTLLNMLRNALSKEPKSGKALGSLEYDIKTNTLVITDIKPVLDKIEKLIAKLDVEPRQVLVEVKYLSTTNAKLQELGLDWTYLAGSGSYVGDDTNPTTGAMTTRISEAAINSDFPFGIDAPQTGGVNPTYLTNYMADAILRLYRRDDQTMVRQSPSVVVINGQEATIYVGDQQEYISSVTVTQQAGAAPITSVSTDTLETGFQLMIIPHIIDGTDKIMMEVIPRNTALVIMNEYEDAGQTYLVQLPHTRDAVLVTRLIMETGLTVVLGGLIRESEEASERKIPFLSDIPWIGKYLFAVEGKRRETEYMFFFITPRIISSSQGTRGEIDQYTGDRSGAADEEFERVRIGPTRDELEGMLDMHRNTQDAEFERIKEGK